MLSTLYAMKTEMTKQWTIPSLTDIDIRMYRQDQGYNGKNNTIINKFQANKLCKINKQAQSIIGGNY